MVPCALKATVVDDRITLMFNNNQMVRVSLQQLTTNDQSTMEYSFVNYMKCQLLKLGDTIIEMHYACNHKNYEFFLYPDKQRIDFIKDLPAKVCHMGQLSLSANWILLFGGISAQDSNSRDQCYLLQLDKRCIQRLDFKLKEYDSFETETYMYTVSADGNIFHVAGRYYVHVFNKQTMQWACLNGEREVIKSMPDRRRDAQLADKYHRRRAKQLPVALGKRPLRKMIPLPQKPDQDE